MGQIEKIKKKVTIALYIIHFIFFTSKIKFHFNLKKKSLRHHHLPFSYAAAVEKNFCCWGCPFANCCHYYIAWSRGHDLGQAWSWPSLARRRPAHRPSWSHSSHLLRHSTLARLDQVMILGDAFNIASSAQHSRSSHLRFHFPLVTHASEATTLDSQAESTPLLQTAWDGVEILLRQFFRVMWWRWWLITIFLWDWRRRIRRRGEGRAESTSSLQGDLAN